MLADQIDSARRVGHESQAPKIDRDRRAVPPAFCSGSVSAVNTPAPISLPARYFETAGHPVRRVELGVQMRFRVLHAVGRRLMKRQDVGKRLLPQTVELQQHGFQRAGEITPLARL